MTWMKLQAETRYYILYIYSRVPWIIDSKADFDKSKAILVLVMEDLTPESELVWISKYRFSKRLFIYEDH